jgi:hypothetical protein
MATAHSDAAHHTRKKKQDEFYGLFITTIIERVLAEFRRPGLGKSNGTRINLPLLSAL